MINKLFKLYIIAILGLGFNSLYAGNPDRQGEAGAYELLMNPWALSSGFNLMNTSCITGVEAMRLNVAGLSRVVNGELILANSQLYVGSDMTMNAGGFATKLKGNGTLGISLVSLNFGDIPVTTTNQPEGTGATFSPNFFQLGVGYSYMYANKISVGVLVRGVSEALPSVTAFGLAIDAGVQYVSGPKDNFKLGISLRNTGTPMEYNGEGLSFQAPNSDPSTSGQSYFVTINQRAEDFEMPSVLNIGVSYDFYINETDYVRGLANFTSNAFSQDQVGVGAELSFRNLVQLRGSYKYNLGEGATTFDDDVYTGLAVGGSFVIPTKKKDSTKRVAIDYAYRPTNPFRGTHNIGVRYAF